jgi:hypothetical protein
MNRVTTGRKSFVKRPLVHFTFGRRLGIQRKESRKPVVDCQERTTAQDRAAARQAVGKSLPAGKTLLSRRSMA